MKPRTTISLLTAALVLGATAAVASPAKRYAGTATDFMEINQLFARYNTAVDNRDGPARAATFTPDGVFQDARRCVIGRAALESLVGSTPMPGRDRERFHVQSLGPIVYASRTAASVRSTIIVVQAAKSDGTVGSWTPAVAEDTLQRIGGQWLIARRVVYQGPETIADTCR